MKNKNSDIPSSILNNRKCIAESMFIANTFNDFFHSVAPAILSKIKFSCKSFNHYFCSKNYNFLTLNPTLKEINTIISSLSNNKSTGSNSIPLKILRLTQNEKSQHLVDIFNLSFKTGFFPDYLKIAKMIPVHKKIQNLQFLITCPYLLYQNFINKFTADFP